ncbi:hypothetical protein M422DRAFT_24261 [Sphaerobolus stellatus SS14]|nr:hypothetical protein M422DRAFT_24261 [Sphaerobolus stellatus SS14]
MPTLRTPLTDLLGVGVPIIVPPMAGATGGKIAAEVASAGGYGFIGVGYLDKPALLREIEIARSILGVDIDQPLNIGAGFLCWILDKGDQAVASLDLVLEQRLKSIWLSFGNDIGKWVNYIRKYDETRSRAHKTLIWILVNSVEEAHRAANEWKADILVVQGNEAGGHGHGEALPLMSLLPLVQRALPNPPPLVAAGGIATGAHVASLLVLGASGAVIGTRYLATPESTYSDNQKNAVLSATHSVRTTAFDAVRGTIGWPAGIDGRAVPNLVLEDIMKGVPFEERKKLFEEAVKKDDVSRTVVWSGSSVGLVTEIVGAAALTRSLREEVVTQLQRVSSILAA